MPAQGAPSNMKSARAPAAPLSKSAEVADSELSKLGSVSPTWKACAGATATASRQAAMAIPAASSGSRRLAELPGTPPCERVADPEPGDAEEGDRQEGAHAALVRAAERAGHGADDAVAL